MTYRPTNTPYKTGKSSNSKTKSISKNISFVIPIAPVTKKNHGQIIIDSNTGKRKLIPSSAYLKYQKEAGYFIRASKISSPVNVKALYYMKDRKTVDLTNLHEALHDIMVDRGFISDDNSRIIVSTDGSRVLYDPKNPRTEVYVDFYEEYKDPFD